MTNTYTATEIVASIVWLADKNVDAQSKVLASLAASAAGSTLNIGGGSLDQLIEATATSRVWTLVQTQLDDGGTDEEKLARIIKTAKEMLLSHWATRTSSWSAGPLADCEREVWSGILRDFDR